jgi:O-antigen/teichoic acid export membrane protein
MLHKKKKTYNVLEKLISVISRISLPMSFGLIVISRHIVILLGKDFQEAGILFCISAPVIFFNSLSYIAGSLFQIYSNNENRFSSTLFFSLLITTVTSILIIPKFGIISAMVIFTINELLILTIHIIRSAKQINFAVIIMANCWKPLIASIIMFILLLIINNYILRSLNIITLILNLTLGVTIYLTSMIILRDENTSNLLSGFSKMVKQSKH